jgi:hypothetical protein
MPPTYSPIQISQSRIGLAAGTAISLRDNAVSGPATPLLRNCRALRVPAMCQLVGIGCPE